jgi:hypothetical protein
MRRGRHDSILLRTTNGSKFAKAYSYALLWKIKLSVIFLDSVSGVAANQY